MSERTVPLTDDQFDRLWKDSLAERFIGRVLAHAINEISEQLAISEAGRWKAVEELAHVDAGEKVSIDWLNRQLVITTEASE